MSQKDTLNFALANFCREYNGRFGMHKVTSREFDLLHEFVCYITPVSDQLMFPKRLQEAGIEL